MVVRGSFATLALGFATIVACSGSSVRDGNTGGSDGGASGAPDPGDTGGSDGAGSDGVGGGTTGAGATGAVGATGAGATGAVGATGAGATGAVGGTAAGGTGVGARGSVAGSQGVPIDPPGPVHCGGVICDSPMACCLATQTCFDPSSKVEACSPPAPDDDPWGRPTCSSNADCDEGYFCQLDSGLCQGTGHCQPIDNCGACGDSGTGVCRLCGCDGNTYPDIQTACLASANVVAVSGAGCGETVMSGGGGSSAGVREHTLCAVDSNCAEDQKCCSITGFCYPTSDPDQCRVPPEGTRSPCTSDAQCRDYEYCFAEGCEAPGGCVPFGSESECGVTFEPVCGCDGTTYTSAACAASRGVRVASDGECTG